MNNLIPKANDILYKRESYEIQGAIFEVYKEMGNGFLEAVYQETLSKEFKTRGIPFASQPEITLRYKGELLSVTYRPDFICYNKIIVEIKAVKETGLEHHAQLLNYLRTTGFRLGLLVNFGHYPKVRIERVII